MTTILNLGCGNRTSPAMVNIDFSIYLRVRQNKVAAEVAKRVLRGTRREQFVSLDDNIVVHDLRLGIPAEDASVDAVYHSHVLEHIDRDVVGAFLREVHRVLKPRGVHRIVVPDLERAVRRYVASLEEGKKSQPAATRHDITVAGILEQMVRREAFGTSQQPRAQRWVESRLLGDARKRGETHQWMWDEVNLSVALTDAGFHSIERMEPTTSAIQDWSEIGLDMVTPHQAYKPGSLYMEGRV